MLLRRSLLLAPLAAGLLPLSSRAAEMAEYYNDYGATGGDVAARNGGFGWAGPWAGATGTGSMQYVPGSQATYAAPGYASTGNATGPNHGAATGTGTGTITYRPTGALTGTIWISAVTVISTPASGGGDTLFWLDKTNTGANGLDRDFIALRGSTGTIGGNTPELVMSYSDVNPAPADDTSSNVDFAYDTPHLFLIRIDMNFSGANDRARVWVDPNLAGGEAGLGTPIYDKSTLDAYGATFDGIGVTGNGTHSLFDAIRVSNEANGFTFVTTGVPEPSALMGAMAMAGVGLLRRRATRR